MSLLCSSTPSRQLHLSTLFFLTPSSTDVSTPLDTFICRELLRIYIYVLRDPVLISSISLNLSAPVHLPNTLSFTSNLFLKHFFEINLVFLHWVSFNSLIFMHFILWNLRFWDFCKIWSFSKSKRFFCNFWMGFEDSILKTSCIAFHVHYNYIFMHLVVCYTCWTICVLVGLDWVEPMIQFLLHITCLCISHAYVLHFQYICYIWNVLGFF